MPPSIRMNDAISTGSTGNRSEQNYCKNNGIVDSLQIAIGHEFFHRLNAPDRDYLVYRFGATSPPPRLVNKLAPAHLRRKSNRLQRAGDLAQRPSTKLEGH